MKSGWIKEILQLFSTSDSTVLSSVSMASHVAATNACVSTPVIPTTLSDFIPGLTLPQNLLSIENFDFEI